MIEIERIVYNLLTANRFYGELLLNCNILYDKHNIPTAGATVLKGIPTIIVNTTFFSSLKFEEQIAVFQHELDHIVYMHMFKKNVDPYIFNIAADCTINQYISNLPQNAILPSTLESTLKVSIEKYQDSMYYYELLIKHKDELSENGISTLDEHNLPVDNNEQQVKIAVKNALNKAVKAAKGEVPDHLKQTLNSLLEEEQISWKQVLRNFIIRSSIKTTKYSRKKPHRRFKFESPAVIKKQELVLAVCADSSGSVSNELFASFINEINSISQCVGRTIFIEADAEVQYVEKLKKGKKLQYRRNSCGGTAYQPAIDRAKKEKANVIIYLGDGDCADVPTNPKVPFLWVLPENFNPPASFGKVLHIKPE